MLKYFTLVNILDKICEEAPREFTFYRPDPTDIEKINQARSQAFIHLFLKVKCGITNFKERQDLITDDECDGGIDAYFIDRDKKRLIIIQSKFRTNVENFEEKSITSDELVKMEVERILKGEPKDTNGNEYNEKIKKFVKEWSGISDHANYEHIIIILGNLTKYNNEQIRKLIDTNKYEIFNFERTYNELVYPVCSGLCYDPKEITVSLDLFEKDDPILKQKVSTTFGDFQVRILFVPAKEIGRILLKYKNSILRYNPRNFLGLSQNKVNKKIRDSILNTNTNDFAVLNNGITFIADNFNFSDATGVVNRGQVVMINPQIINGGQTAYTLCKIYDENNINAEQLDSVFKNKEVMVKVVIIGNTAEPNIKFIKEVSNATNQQTRVEEADRRSNEEIQINLQKLFFEKFGYFYERKRGEFYNGINDGYINKDIVIDRYELLRSYLAFKGLPSVARRSGSDTLFKEGYFGVILDDVSNYKKMLFSYLIYKNLEKIERKEGEDIWGRGLRYGKMAIISAIGFNEIDFDSISKLDDLNRLVEEKINYVKGKWLDFEKWSKGNDLNKIYLYQEAFDFDNYYKGVTLNSNIKEFFGNQN